MKAKIVKSPLRDLFSSRRSFFCLCYDQEQQISLLTMQFLVILASLVSAAAFSPAKVSTRSSALKMGFESELGAQAPLGFWDPLGLLKYADQARFERLREVENKHGRISMLAILGHIVTAAGVRLPGEIAFGVPFSSMKVNLTKLPIICMREPNNPLLGRSCRP
jgi:hypothetical protein